MKRGTASDACVVVVAALGMLLGSCHGARASEPVHWQAPPTQQEFASVKAEGSVVVALDEATWRGLLGRLIVADAVAKERDAAVAASDASNAEARALRVELEEVRAENARMRQALADSDAALLRCERSRSRWRWWTGVAAGVAAGEAIR